jgi:uncharacterized protein
MPWDFWVIFILLGVILPWRGQARLKKLLALPTIRSSERRMLYASTIAFQWASVAVVAWRAWARGLTLADLGLRHPFSERIILVAIAGAATFGALQWFNLRRIGRSPDRPKTFIQQLGTRILPQSRKELLLYLALAATAGLCEEFIYRGFAMAALARAGLPVWSAVLSSSVLFALAHLYQGRGGWVSTLVIGTVFGTARIAYDGLVPVVAWHIAVDAVAGVAGPRYLLRNPPPAEQTRQEESVKT